MARFGKRSFNGREVSFEVRECLPEDAGAYTCLAENSAGKTSCCAAVFVRGKGEAGDCSVMDIRGNSWRHVLLIS